MVTRYFTKDKRKAFALQQQLNNEITNWNVAVRMRNYVIFDIDNESIDNVKKIVNYYSKIYGDLKVYKSHVGYHIYSKKYANEYDWHYDCCRVLYPLLETKDFIKYLGKVNEWYNQKLKEEFELKLTREQFIENIKNTFPDSGLYCGVGDFDILFALMVLFKGYYCIRISKKYKDDNRYEVTRNLGSVSVCLLSRQHL